MSTDNSVYPVLKKMLLVCRLFLYAPYQLDGERNLRKSPIQDYVQHTILMTFHTIVLVGRIAEIITFSISNPYKILSRIRIFYVELYALQVFCKTKMEYESIRKVFDRVKVIDDAVRLTAEQEGSFSRQLRKRILQIFIYFILCLVYIYRNTFGMPIWALAIWSSIVTLFVLQPFVCDVLLWLLLVICEQYYGFVYQQLESMQKTIRPHKAVHISNLRTLYGKTHTVLHDINAVYADRLLTGILFNFFETVYYTFAIIIMLKNWREISITKLYSYIIFMLLYIMCLFNRMWIILTVQSRLCKQRKCISKAVHKLMKEPADRKTTTELSIFSLELLHRKNNITANGFFTVDNTIIKSLLSGAMSIILILIQVKFPGYENGIRPIEDLMQ
ncbi:UNVERIFIED_CONTAM: hypothetical protein PYX00_005896 [Menopon gallinae]|uniref:Gustatory receptor n=1 Tax=Menopon gallinae TaxID=328185 RepID=A0AAW2HTM3_9NEOP